MEGAEEKRDQAVTQRATRRGTRRLSEAAKGQ